MREHHGGGSEYAANNNNNNSSSSSSFLVIGDADDGVGGGEEEDDGGEKEDGGGDKRGRHRRQRFVRTLDTRLRGLQRHPSRASRKPVFVTTVKTGIFLDPPPDLAALLGLDDRSSTSATETDRYYSYSSEPRVLHDKPVHRQRVQRTTTAAAAAVSSRKTDRRHDICKQNLGGYTNVMHDKRVVRGSNFAKKTFYESPAAREAEARRRAMARKRAMDYQTRALRLHLGAPKLTRGRQNVDIQTDSHLEELFEHPPCQTFGAQTEFDPEPQTYQRFGTSAGTDASTQVDDKDLFDFDTEVTPIAESLIANVFRQAMREVLYEDELETRARQQRALYLRRTIEDYDKQRLEHEDERLNKVKVHHARLFDEGEIAEKARISALTSDRVIELLPEELKNRNSEEFVSWLVEELKDNKHSDSDEMLKSIIDDLVKNRLDTHNKVTDVQNIQKPEELFEEIESVTSQSYQTNEADSR